MKNTYILILSLALTFVKTGDSSEINEDSLGTDFAKDKKLKENQREGKSK